MLVDHRISPDESFLNLSMTKPYCFFPAPADSEMILAYCQKIRSRIDFTADGGMRFRLGYFVFVFVDKDDVVAVVLVCAVSVFVLVFHGLGVGSRAKGFEFKRFIT